MNRNECSTWKKAKTPRGKYHNKTENKTTVSLYLNKKVVEKARKHKLNLSRVTEQALNSILDYLETQNTPTAPERSSKFLGSASFQKKVRCRGPGLNRRQVEISPAHSPLLWDASISHNDVYPWQRQDY